MNLLAASFSAPQIEWASLIPIIVVLGGAVVGILIEAFAPVKARRILVIAVCLLTTLIAGAVLATRWLAVQGAPSTLGEYIEDPLTLAAQFILVLIAFLALLVMADRTEIGDGVFAAQPSDRPGSADEELSDTKGYQRSEMFPLTLFSVAGMMLFPAADSYVMLFIALEVMSLPLYILAATARRRRQLSQEAALKYFILGAFASGFLLMGSAFLYGVSGSLTISDAASILPNKSGMDWIALTGVVMVMVGLLFKVGAAPFHSWTPDVYTGAPTSVTGFMAAGVKVAAFAAMLRFYESVAAILQWDLLPVLFAVAILTMLVGTFTGIVQSDVKRMLAFSSIAHAGFILIGVFSLTKGATGHVLFYLLAYGLATVGAFAVVSLVRTTSEDGLPAAEATALSGWAGLGKKSPLLAAAMLIFLLSFAGIPLTAGFVGKFVVFADGFAGGMTWLVVLALACSAVTAFYYFRLVRLMFFTDPAENTLVVRSEGFAGLAVVVCALGTLLLGIFPAPVLSILSQVVILLP